METEKPQSESAIERAKEYGIDLTLTEFNLSLTPTERLQQLQAFVNFVERVRSQNLSLSRNSKCRRRHVGKCIKHK
jgi:hypothetical protein